MSENASLNRREFIAFTCLCLAGCSKDSPVTPKVPFTIAVDLDDSNNAALRNIGGAVVRSGVIIIRRSTSAYIALSLTCTHAACTVNYNAGSGKLICPCHGSTFNNQGQVLQGPATSPLPSYSVVVTGSTLTVTT